MKHILLSLVLVLTFSFSAFADECVSGDCVNGYGKFIFSDGTTYIGEFKNNIMQGQGIILYPDGTKMIGTWKNGKPHGQGTINLANGDEYIGSIESFLRHGLGTFTYTNGKILRGLWKENELIQAIELIEENSVHGCIIGDCINGSSTFIDNDGKYVGEYKDGIVNGKGTYKSPEGWRVYSDNFKENKENIFGDGEAFHISSNGVIKFIIKNGEILKKKLQIGCIDGDCVNGYGTFANANGNMYVGEFKNSNYEGQGQFTFVSGENYKGEFKNSTWHGQGTYTFAEGGYYTGEYKNNLQHGQGTEIWMSSKNEGDKYVGEYKNGVMHGQGTLTLANGSKYVGTFKNSSPYDVYAISYKSNGDVYSGKWKNEKRNGQGTYYFANGDVYTGEWKNDLKHGQGKYHKIGFDETLIGIWKNDEFVKKNNS